jgi:hypothetical protein
MRRLPLFAALLLPACTPAAPTAPVAAAKAPAEDEAVKAFILYGEADPDSVEFVRWGPHDLDGTLKKAYAEAEKAPAGAGKAVIGGPASDGALVVPRRLFEGADRIYRVRYGVKGRAGWERIEDRLVGCDDGAPKIELSAPNPFGDDWLERYRRAFAANKAKPKGPGQP